jgi:hypothetical protein
VNRTSSLCSSLHRTGINTKGEREGQHSVVHASLSSAVARSDRCFASEIAPALRSMSCHLAPGEAMSAARELPPPSMRAQEPTRDHPCLPKSKIDDASNEADAMSPTFRRALALYSARNPKTLFLIFKGTSIRDLRSKAATPHAPVPDICPSYSGLQSPRHPHPSASCIGQR